MHVRDILSHAGGSAFLAGLALTAALGWPAQEARAQPSEAVQALDRALIQPLPPSDPNDKDWAKKALDARRKQLAQAADQLTTLNDMAQGLLLSTWGDERVPLTDTPDSSRVDRDARQALLQRFLDAVKKTIKLGDDTDSPTLREAVATLVGEFAASARSGVIGARASNRLLIDGLPAFAYVLANMAKTDKAPWARAAAARSLSKLRVAPDVTMGALTSVLKDRDPFVRRAAAGALTAILRGAPAAERTGFAAPVAEPTRDNLIEFGPKVAQAAGSVLNNQEPDAEVRRRSAGALSQLAQTLNSQLRSAEAPADLHRTLQPVWTALWDQVQPLNRGTQDPDPETRFTSLRALEEMGDVRLHWIRPESLPIGPTPESRPPKPRPKAAAGDPLGEIGLTLAVEQAQPARDEPPPLSKSIQPLVDNLRSPDVRTRLSAIDALESITARPDDQTVAQELGKDAAANAAKALTRAVYDRDRFVRWAAARTLGKMAPLDDVASGQSVERAAVAALTWLLSDPDPDVRLRNAYALEQFGKAAASAVPALAVAASRGDTEARIAAAHAIEAIGGSPEAAVPALASGLSSDNVRLRRATAEALAKYGASARAARPALEQALRDQDPEVRRLVSDSLIAIGTAK
jgi:hypothetical protein